MDNCLAQEFEQALADAAAVDLCPACVAHSGLCAYHARLLCPRLAQPFWYQLVGTHYQTKAPILKPSAPAQRVIDRKRRKAESRLLRALTGQSAPTRKAA